MAVEAETVEFINCNNKEYEICDAKAREKFDAIDNLKDMAYEEKINYPTVTDLNNAVVNLQRNFQAGVNAVYDAVYDKGVTPASKSLEDIVTAIGQIETGGNYGTLEIDGTNGTYDPADEGLDAYNLVIVDKDFDQPHTVVFYDIDGETIIKTQANVPYHGYATCTALDGTHLNGLYFKGQNPSPTNIIRDTFCFPIYGEYSISSGEIEDDQETICSNCGAPYPIGAYKPLVFTASTQVQHRFYDDTDDTKYVDVTLGGMGNIVTHMVKVAEGEDGSTSTQLSNTVIGTPPFNSYAFQTVGTEQDQSNSGTRIYLNEGFFQDLPIYLKDAIKTVTKQTRCAYPRQRAQTKNSVLKETLDKIQIPSIKEISSLLTKQPSEYSGGTGIVDIRNSGGYSRASSDPTYIQSIIDNDYETKGIDYCENQQPTNQLNQSQAIQVKFRSVPFPPGYNMNADILEIMKSSTPEKIAITHNGNNLNLAPIGFCL